MRMLFLIYFSVLLGSCCAEPSTIRDGAQPEAAIHVSDLDAVVRAAIDIDLDRPTAGIGFHFDIDEKERAIIGNYSDIALKLLEDDLQTDNRIRRANAYDYLDRLFITPGKNLETAGNMVLKYRAIEKDPWVRALADQVATLVLIRRNDARN